MGAAAYLDANAGSMIVTAVAAGSAGAVVAAKMGWQRLRHPMAKRRADGAAAPEQPAAQPVEQPADQA